MSDHAGFVDVGPARRLANAIATAKTVLIVIAAGGAVLGTIGGGAVVLLFGFVAIVSIYVTFGWLEHTLRLLVGIAFNTAEAADLEPGVHD